MWHPKTYKPVSYYSLCFTCYSLYYKLQMVMVWGLWFTLNLFSYLQNPTIPSVFLLTHANLFLFLGLYLFLTNSCFNVLNELETLEMCCWKLDADCIDNHFALLCWSVICVHVFWPHLRDVLHPSFVFFFWIASICQ